MPIRGGSRGDDPSHVHDTAARIDASHLCQMVLRVIRMHGPPHGLALCVAEIWKNYLPELSVDTISPRMVQLEELGLIVCLGKEPRPNRYGNVRKQFVYMCTDKGRGRETIYRVGEAVKDLRAGEPFSSFK
jgi:hypothetical protein